MGYPAGPSGRGEEGWACRPLCPPVIGCGLPWKGEGPQGRHLPLAESIYKCILVFKCEVSDFETLVSVRMNYLEDLWNIVCWFHSQSLWFRRSWVEPENLRFYKVPQWPPFENGGFKWVLISEWGRIECSGTEKAIAGVLKLLPCIPTTSDFFLCPILASQPLVCLSVDGLRTGATAIEKKGDGTHSHMAMEVRKWNKHYLLSEVTHVLVFSLGLFLFLQSSLFSSLKWSGRGLFTTRSLVPDSRFECMQCNGLPEGFT